MLGSVGGNKVDSKVRVEWMRVQNLRRRRGGLVERREKKGTARVNWP